MRKLRLKLTRCPHSCPVVHPSMHHSCLIVHPGMHHLCLIVHPGMHAHLYVELCPYCYCCMLSATDTCMHACRAAARLAAYNPPFVGDGCFACTVKHARSAFLELHFQDAYHLHSNHPKLHPQPTPLTCCLQILFVLHLACTFQLSCSWLACSNFSAPASVDDN